MEAYEHGLSVSRYLTALAMQAPITFFSFLYLTAGSSGRSRKPILLVALALAVVIGAIRGYVRARAQYQFL
jgi:hypothetical protein